VAVAYNSPAASVVGERIAAHHDPAEALEALVACGVWPARWLDSATVAWWCETCGGRGCGTPECSCGESSRPPSVRILAAVASLGRASLLRAEQLAAEIMPTNIAWRGVSVRPAAETPEWDDPGSDEWGTWFSGERLAWPERLPWRGDDEENGPTYEAMRELAALGVRVLACGPQRIVLGAGEP
jgi:hypothetical protein